MPVPKSTTIAGPPNIVNAASVFTTRSAPTSRGLSVSTDTPVFMPGPTTSGSCVRYAAAISRNCPVTSGTTLARHSPVTSLRRSRSRCSRKPDSSSASSSEVRSGRVEERQVWRSVGAVEDAEHDLGIADVGGEQHGYPSNSIRNDGPS